MPRLFHFSEESDIEIFVPRPVKVASKRKPGMDWLNGPLVWAIDEWHQPMYLFPRDCPRILIWPTADSNQEDIYKYFSDSGARIVAYVEKNWSERIKTTTMYRYELPVEPFECLQDAGMWVSRKSVLPLQKKKLTKLTEILLEQNVLVKEMDSLRPFKDLWQTTLHVSGIRLRNAVNWT